MDSSGNALARVFKCTEKAVDGEQCLIARLRERVEGLRVDNHDPVLALVILIFVLIASHSFTPVTRAHLRLGRCGYLLFNVRDDGTNLNTTWG